MRVAPAVSRRGRAVMRAQRSTSWLGRQSAERFAQLVGCGDDHVACSCSDAWVRALTALARVLRSTRIDFDDPVARLGDRGRLAGQDRRSRGGLGVARVGLAAVAAADARRARDLDDLDALQREQAGQAGAVAAGALDAGASQRAVPARPRDQRAVPRRVAGTVSARDDAAERIEQHGGVQVA